MSAPLPVSPTAILGTVAPLTRPNTTQERSDRRRRHGRAGQQRRQGSTPLLPCSLALLLPCSLPAPTNPEDTMRTTHHAGPSHPVRGRKPGRRRGAREFSLTASPAYLPTVTSLDRGSGRQGGVGRPTTGAPGCGGFAVTPAPPSLTGAVTPCDNRDRAQPVAHGRTRCLPGRAAKCHTTPTPAPKCHRACDTSIRPLTWGCDTCDTCAAPRFVTLEPAPGRACGGGESRVRSRVRSPEPG